MMHAEDFLGPIADDESPFAEPNAAPLNTSQPDTERRFLAAATLDPSLFTRHGVTEGTFAAPGTVTIARLILEAAERGEQPSPELLRTHVSTSAARDTLRDIERIIRAEDRDRLVASIDAAARALVLLAERRRRVSLLSQAHVASVEGHDSECENRVRDVVASYDAARARRSPAAAKPAGPPDLAAICRALPGSFKRVPTRNVHLDRRTNGGLQTRRLMVIGGAPGATKTGWAIAMAHAMASAGVNTPEGHRPIVVAFIAGDEPREGVLSRLGQIEGMSRSSLEDEDTSNSGPAWKYVADRLAEIPDLLVFDPRNPAEPSTVEAIAEVAAARARERGARLVVIVDSIQSAPFATDATVPGGREPSVREKIDARMKALASLAVRHDACAVALSELNRGGYGNGKKPGLDSFKESSSIEYGVDVALVLERVRGEGFVIDVTAVKNRLGDSGVTFRLRRNERCLFESVASPDEPDEGDRTAARVAANEAATQRFERELLLALARAPGPVRSATALASLVKGTKGLKLAAANRLVASGRVVEDGNRLVIGGGECPS
jgi:replicative DNA helicase